MCTAWKRLWACLLLILLGPTVGVAAQFRAGAAQVDITPLQFPVRVNGMVEERTAERAADALMSRAVVLDDGSVQLAIVVVDSLMLPREMLDDVKQRAQLAVSMSQADNGGAPTTTTHGAGAAAGGAAGGGIIMGAYAVCGK